jgi:hypothetical protein
MDRCGVHDLLHVRLLDKPATAARVPTIVTNLRRRAKKELTMSKMLVLVSAE